MYRAIRLSRTMRAEAALAALHPARGPFPWLAGLALAGLLATAFLAEGPVSLPGICGSLSLAITLDAALLAARLLSPGALLFAWLLMLVAMMPPLLVQPVVHIWHSSLAARRSRALALFAFGYASVWVAAGGLLIPGAVMLRIAAPGGGAAVAVAIAIVWSCSPAAQAARNRCHRVYRLAPFGLVADRDCLGHGARTGLACAAACWPWMLVPMTIHSFHVGTMLVAALVLFAERLAPSRPPRWQWPPALEVLGGLLRAQKVFGKL
jgi:predicted metal-binding membrane protein